MLQVIIHSPPANNRNLCPLWGSPFDPAPAWCTAPGTASMQAAPPGEWKEQWLRGFRTTTTSYVTCWMESFEIDIKIIKTFPWDSLATWIVNLLTGRFSNISNTVLGMFLVQPGLFCESNCNDNPSSPAGVWTVAWQSNFVWEFRNLFVSHLPKCVKSITPLIDLG